MKTEDMFDILDTEFAKGMKILMTEHGPAGAKEYKITNIFWTFNFRITTEDYREYRFDAAEFVVQNGGLRHKPSGYFYTFKFYKWQEFTPEAIRRDRIGMNRPQCECGGEAQWRGDERGRRTYSCASCYATQNKM